MCLGVPGLIVELYEGGDTLLGKVDFAGVSRDVCFASCPNVKVGDYVLVHVGFALTVLDESSAHETLALFREFGLIDGELGSDAEIVPQS